MQSKYVFIVIFLFLSNFVISQTKTPKQMKTWELKQYAQDAELKKNNQFALLYYEELYNRNQKNNKYKYKKAYYLLQNRYFEAAKNLFEELYISQNYKFKESLFYYADINRTLGNYDIAKTKFKEFNDITNKNELIELKFLATNAIKGMALLTDTNNIKKIFIHHLNSSINRPHLESSPIILCDSLFVYSSFYLDSLKDVMPSENTCPLSKFYLAKKINNIWQGGFSPVAPFFNLPLGCNANGAFSADKTRFYFTIKTISDRNIPVSHLYYSILENNIWSEPQLITNQVNLKYYNSTQPAVGYTFNPNLEIIYFVSDRPDGWGGLDIWFTVYDKIHKTFTKPLNAGGYINTLGDEMTPFYDNPNKTMYFSSNGLAGYGGFDIFQSLGDIMKWTPAENVGTPINTTFDEFYFSKIINNETGFFISNRSVAFDWGVENCCFDIFQFDNVKPEKIKITGQLVIPDKTINEQIENIISDNNYLDTNNFNNFIPDAIVNLNVINNDNNLKINIFRDTTDIDGNFSFYLERGQNYVITVNAEGFLFSDYYFNTFDIVETEEKTIKNIKAEPIWQKNIIFNNILFEYNSPYLTEESLDYIDSVVVPLLQKFDDIIVEISAHTDNMGTSEYNQELSQNRANSVTNYLVYKGINPNRMTAKGYGETRQIVSEFNTDGTDNADARKINRRVEFEIIGFINK